VQRLAVLLAAGVAPASAWVYVAESSASPFPRRVVDALDGTTRVDDAIAACIQGTSELEASAWRGLAAAWSVATEAGAPLAPALREFAASLRGIAQVQRDIAVALAAPIATARVVTLLPVVGILFGAALGFDTIGTLLTTPLGIACLVSGALLLLAASRWNKRLIAHARPKELAAGLECELTAVAVSGGGALDRSLDTVAAELERFGIASTGRADVAIALSRRAGVPAAELLRSEADEERREARTEAELAAAALSVKLMLPLGLCILPAFMVLGVVPLLVTVISSTVTTF
jgi:tight adherence protein B